MNETSSVYPLILLYDSACPICRSEMDALRERDQGGKLRFVDIASPGFDATSFGTDLVRLNAVIHGITADGRVLTGVEVLRLAYAAAGLGWLLEPAGWPLLRPLFDRGYALFARHRYGISAVLAPLIERVAALRTARRMQRCRDVSQRDGPCRM